MVHAVHIEHALWAPGHMNRSATTPLAIGRMSSSALKDFGFLEKTLDQVLNTSSDELEAYQSEEGIAAVEALAQCLQKGRQDDAYISEVERWIRKLKQ